MTLVVVSAPFGDASACVADGGGMPANQPPPTVHAAWTAFIAYYRCRADAEEITAATVDVYLYRDSLARRAVVARLDPLAFAPLGQPSPWGTPRDVVENGNLVAIVVGGTDRQRDRIATALAAGPGAP